MTNKLRAKRSQPVDRQIKAAGYLAILCTPYPWMRYALAEVAEVRGRLTEASFASYQGLKSAWA